MKSEERHELAKNDLETALDRGLDRIEPYSNHILGAVLLATAVAVGVIIWMRSSQNASDAGWAELSAARTPEQFLKIAEDHPSSSAAAWGQVRGATILYDRGVSTSLTNRAASDDDLRQAREAYSKLLQGNAPPQIRELALNGMARCLEATSSGDVSESIAAYEKLITEFPESIYCDYAQHRIDVLKNPESKEFYAWFSKQNPKPEDRPAPKDGAAKPGAVKTPELPKLNLDVPLPGESKTPATPESTETPKTGTPESTEAPKAGDLPAPEAKSGDAPATPPAAPAESTEKPAETSTEKPSESPAVPPAAETPAETPPAPAPTN
jgi:hypothetical protein